MAAGNYAGTTVILIASTAPVVAVFEAFEIVPPPEQLKLFAAELPQLDRAGRIALAKLRGMKMYDTEPDDDDEPA